MQRLAAAVAPIAVLGVVACAPTHPEVRHIVASEQPRPTGLGESVAALHELRTVATTPPPPSSPSAASAPKAKRRMATARVSRAAAAPRGDVWGALARCESGMRNDTGAPYYGYFQFSAPTWRSLGYGGLPHEHDYATQLTAAQRLVQRSGWGQFPACARKLGLR